MALIPCFAEVSCFCRSSIRC